jgi:hypothetical protein
MTGSRVIRKKRFSNIFKVLETKVLYSSYESGGNTFFALLLDDPDMIIDEGRRINNAVWVCKGVRHSTREARFDEIDRQYIENGNIDFVEGKYISAKFSLMKSVMKYQGSILYDCEFDSYDAINEFNKELELSGGADFATQIKVYDFLRDRVKRKVENDGSIKLFSRFGDMRIYYDSPCCKCCKYDPSYITELDPERDSISFHRTERDITDLYDAVENETVSFSHTERDNVDLYDDFGGEGDEDVYVSDGIYIRPDGSHYDEKG